MSDDTHLDPVSNQYRELLPLEETYQRLFRRHLETSRRIDWTYHDFLPVEQFGARRHRAPLSDLAYAAVEVAALTESNLPWYTAFIVKQLPADAESLLRFVEVWTAEEDQHSLLLESYLLVTGNGDGRRRAKLRRDTLAAGFDLGYGGSFAVAVYTALQELQTRIFYLRTAGLLEAEDPDLARALRRLAKDETLHMDFYRDVVKAHLQADPNFVLVIQEVMERFAMPGANQPHYQSRSSLLQTHVLDLQTYSGQVIEFICKYWEIDTLTPPNPASQRALRKLQLWRRIIARTKSIPMIAPP